jgi:hypothetical protein
MVNPFWKYVFIALWLFGSKLNGQNDTFWIGESLSEIVFSHGRWFIQTKYLSTVIKEENSKYYTVDDVTGKIRHELDFEQLNVGLDTLKLTLGLKILLFVKPTIIADNQFGFHAFEYAVLDPWGVEWTKYHLNRYGLFRKSNSMNKTLVEKIIPKEQLAEFEILFRKIDIINMNEASGWRNVCSDNDYSFTFWNTSGRPYNYTSVHTRRQLIPIQKFIVGLEN